MERSCLLLPLKPMPEECFFYFFHWHYCTEGGTFITPTEAKAYSPLTLSIHYSHWPDQWCPSLFYFSLCHGHRNIFSYQLLIFTNILLYIHITNARIFFTPTNIFQHSIFNTFILTTNILEGFSSNIFSKQNIVWAIYHKAL